jgi:hypothetical protein
LRSIRGELIGGEVDPRRVTGVGAIDAHGALHVLDDVPELLATVKAERLVLDWRAARGDAIDLDSDDQGSDWIRRRKEGDDG